MDIVFASHNAHKRAEVEAIMAAIWPEVRLVAPIGEAPEETGDTFEENALIKARAGHAATGAPTIADDSGICVDALDGQPGVRSARYSPGGADKDNLWLLLENLGMPPSVRPILSAQWLLSQTAKNTSSSGPGTARLRWPLLGRVVLATTQFSFRKASR